MNRLSIRTSMFSATIAQMWSVRALLAALCGVLFLPSTARAQNDTRQVVVPYAAGNGLDLLARTLGDAMRTQSGTSAVIINKGGSGGVIGTAFVAHAPADGRTVLMHAHPPFGTAPLFQKPAAYDPRTSFIPVARIGTVPMVLVTSPRSLIKTFDQLTQYAVANPKRANYASSGIGSPGQIYTEMLKSAAGLPITEIPYASPAQAQVDVMSGEVLVSMISMPAAKPHLQSGALSLLAVGSPKRLPEYPDVPTMAEATGKPDFEAGISYALFVPARTPTRVVEQLYADVAKAYATPAVKTWLEQNNVSGSLQSPAEFSTWLNADLAGMTRLVESAKLATGIAGMK
jgi:tripartite-type tricarboxylate transporter receptor subunit TctC